MSIGALPEEIGFTERSGPPPVLPIAAFLHLGSVIFGWIKQFETRTVDKTIARLNVERFRKQLANETDETRRKVILRLLADEEAKLAAFKPPQKSRDG